MISYMCYIIGYTKFLITRKITAHVIKYFDVLAENIYRKLARKLFSSKILKLKFKAGCFHSVNFVIMTICFFFNPKPLS